MESQQQTLTFKAETKQLLDLVARSLYSKKDIFLRELISNASDAADKLRYEALTDEALYEGHSDLKIWVDFDDKSHTITITDNGIGMTRDEVVENLGMIAKSGTKAFRELLSGDNAKDSQLIGQFGVGFYSAFIVADKVVVRTRRAGTKTDQGVCWESEGKGEYTIKNIEHPKRGTQIVLHIKKDDYDLLNGDRIRTIIRQYSDHILLPILMKKTLTEQEKKSDETVIPEEEVVNQANALWTLPKSKIKNEEYNELYKHITHDFEDPLAWAHNKVEGKSEYISLLYVPARAPYDLWQREGQRGLKLYVKRVFIMDDAEHFMPMYLRFVKGIIDSSDLPLNMSRELLQRDRTIDLIRSACVKRVLSLLEDMAKNDKEKYAKFWGEFGQVLKEGPAEDFANKDRIAKLIRFCSTYEDTNKQTISFDDYVARMKPEQDKIYYLIADSYAAAKNSPLLELFRKKNIEVILMHDRVDEWLMGNLREYDGKPLQSISQGDLDLGGLDDKDAKEKQQAAEKDYEDFITQAKSLLGDRVKDVRLTHRLTDSPACVVFDANGLTGHMARLLKEAGQEVPESKPILELNSEHAIVQKVKTEANTAKQQRWLEVLLNQGLLAEGETLKDPTEFIKAMNQLLIEA